MIWLQNTTGRELTLTNPKSLRERMIGQGLMAVPAPFFRVSKRNY
jgi:hypothetical protein